MDPHQLWFSAMGSLVIVAVGALAVLGRRGGVLVELVGEFGVKVTAKAIQVVAGGLTVYVGVGVRDPAEKEKWLAAALAGVLAVLLWEVVSLWADSLAKAADRADKAALAALEQECDARTELLAVFRDVVDRKVRRLTRAAGDERRPNLTRLRTVLGRVDMR